MMSLETLKKTCFLPDMKSAMLAFFKVLFVIKVICSLLNLELAIPISLVTLALGLLCILACNSLGGGIVLLYYSLFGIFDSKVYSHDSILYLSYEIILLSLFIKLTVEKRIHSSFKTVPSSLKLILVLHCLWWVVCLFNPQGPGPIWSLISAQTYIGPILVFMMVLVLVEDLDRDKRRLEREGTILFFVFLSLGILAFFYNNFDELSVVGLLSCALIPLYVIFFENYPARRALVLLFISCVSACGAYYLGKSVLILATILGVALFLFSRVKLQRVDLRMTSFWTFLVVTMVGWVIVSAHLPQDISFDLLSGLHSKFSYCFDFPRGLGVGVVQSELVSGPLKAAYQVKGAVGQCYNQIDSFVLYLFLEMGVGGVFFISFFIAPLVILAREALRDFRDKNFDRSGRFLIPLFFMASLFFTSVLDIGLLRREMFFIFAAFFGHFLVYRRKTNISRIC